MHLEGVVVLYAVIVLNDDHGKYACVDEILYTVRNGVDGIFPLFRFGGAGRLDANAVK